MSENEKNIIKQLASTVPKLSKNNQNYILGVAEGMAIVKEELASNERKRELQEV